MTYGAVVMNWPPDVMRRQRIGDLHAVLDAQMDRLGRMSR